MGRGKLFRVLGVLGLMGAIAALAAPVLGRGWGAAPPGETTPFQANSRKDGYVSPSSLTSKWVTAVKAGTGGVTTLDNAAITNPDTQIAAAKSAVSRASWMGTNIQVRLVYNPASVTAVTPLKLGLFGRTGDEEGPTRLRNANGDLSLTITPNTTTDVRFTDSLGATWAYTDVDLLLNVFDCQGCDSIRAGVEQALVLTGGDGTTAYLQFKIY